MTALMRVVLLQKFLHVILRKTLLKKGSSSNSFPKTFEFKVFGRGYGGRLPTVWGDVSEADRGDRLRQRNLSSERFPPIITYKTAL